MSNNLGLTWRDVLDSVQCDDIWKMDYYIERVVRISGYKYFSWNGLVYDVHGEKVGISIELLD